MAGAGAGQEQRSKAAAVNNIFLFRAAGISSNNFRDVFLHKHVICTVFIVLPQNELVYSVFMAARDFYDLPGCPHVYLSIFRTNSKSNPI